MVEGMGREEMRAADGDRQQVADRLRTALDEGRLELHEYDERLQRAYAAKTYGELDVLLADLPGSRAVPPGAGSGNPTAEWLGQVWSAWVFVVGITSAVWLVSCLASGWQYYWPVWVAVPWGMVLVFVSVAGLAGGEPRKMVEKRERKALAKKHKALGAAGAEQAGQPDPRDEKGGMSGSRVADTPDHG